jgi:hypothetical protein
MVAMAFTHREAVTRLAILDAPMAGWSQWEAACHREWCAHLRLRITDEPVDAQLTVAGAVVQANGCR